MNTLEIKNLCKSYEKFSLKNVSFSIEKGEIRGFIGRNGAGKTTTLKSILNLVHPDSGQVDFFGIPFEGNEKDIKQRIGYAIGGIIKTAPLDEFVGSYRIVNLERNGKKSDDKSFLGISRTKNGATALINEADSGRFDGSAVAMPTLESIMVHLEKEEI